MKTGSIIRIDLSRETVIFSSLEHTNLKILHSGEQLSTEADASGVQNQSNESPAEYLTPKTIKVRKYRLKK